MSAARNQLLKALGAKPVAIPPYALFLRENRGNPALPRAFVARYKASASLWHSLAVPSKTALYKRAKTTKILRLPRQFVKTSGRSGHVRPFAAFIKANYRKTSNGRSFSHTLKALAEKYKASQ